jgi:thiosulfate reductase cytochrome b subunit
MPDYWPQWLKIAAILLVVMVLAMAVHYLLRLMNRHHHKPAAEEQTYLYKLPIRLWHWINAVLFLGLLATGLLNHFNIGPMAEMVQAHKVLAVLYICAWLCFIVLNVVTGNSKNYIIRWSGFCHNCIEQARFYLYGIIKGEPHPFAPEEGNKFNPLQQPSYIAVVYMLLPIIIVTGLISLFPNIFGKHTGSLTAHFGAAVVGVIFLLVHLYMCTGGAYFTQLFKGMIDGYSRHEKRAEE